MQTYKFRLYPGNETQQLLWKHANALNSIYNYFLNQKIEAYKTNKVFITKNQQSAELVSLKKENPLLKEIYSQVLQEVTKRLDISYKNFFRRIKDSKAKAKGFPSFRSCKNFFGLCYPQSGFKIIDNYFVTTNYGRIPFIKHREILGKIKTVYISCTSDNEWYISILTNHAKEIRTTNQSVGIDVGITNLVATSDGQLIKNYHHAKYFDKQINKLKSKKDKLQKGSRKQKFYSKVVKRLYGVKNRKINDFQHKVSYGLSRKYDMIFIENLELKQMSETYKTGLNRELRNAKIAQFITFLKYKTKMVIEVNPRNTSKTCCKCGKIHDMPLNKREMNCECGNKMDRDINAANNIYCLGQAILSGECSAESSLQEAPAFRRG